MPTLEEWLRKYESENRLIRIRSAVVLLDQPDRVPLNVLIDILVSLSYEGLGAKATRVLCQRKDEGLVPEMIKLLGSEDPWLREAACKILGNTGNKKGTEYLLRMFNDPHVMVRRAAGFALASLKDRSCLEQVRKLRELHDKDDINVRIALDCVLQKLGDDPLS